MPFGSRESRKLLLTMVVLVVLLDAIAITAYYTFDVSQRAAPLQNGFVVVWTLITLAIVAVYLGRIRRIRNAAVSRKR